MLMYIGFSGYRISSLSVIEILQGDRSITELFKPNNKKIIKRFHYELSDTNTYYSTTRYNQSLRNVWQGLFSKLSKEELNQIISDICPLSNEEVKHYAKQKYFNRSTEKEEITKYLMKLKNRPITTKYNLLERVVYAAAAKIDKNDLVQRMKDINLSINYNKDKVQAEFAIFQYDFDGTLTTIVSR